MPERAHGGEERYQPGQESRLALQKARYLSGLAIVLCQLERYIHHMQGDDMRRQGIQMKDGDRV